MNQISLQFDKGTIVLRDVPEQVRPYLPGLRWDDRISNFRAPAYFYREIVLTLRKVGSPYLDQARTWAPLALALAEPIEPRSFQSEAAETWKKTGRRGVVVLPTGAGKTILAVMLIANTGRPTLIHAPTIDLMHQWHEVLSRFLGMEIGRWGGGYHETQPITVSTYESALRRVESKGDLFGMIVFDECHHLPGEQYRFTALGSMAPFRLGLTATPERTDRREAHFDYLCGPICYRADIRDLAGETLAPYQVETIEVEMQADERAEYEEANAHYKDFLQEQGVDMSRRGGWRRFLFLTSQSPEGRAAFKAYLRQRQLSQASAAKIDWVWSLIRKHGGDRIIVFTQDNEMAYRIGKRFLLPVMTHQTRIKERESFLQAFREGSYSILVTSKVLNEGVDVPEANVAIIVSGSGSVREHVQRLGRILRARPGKVAILYELISSDTREIYVNERRKRHHAYQKPGSV